jgi:glycosyltransferase involved in cell wall biosynthesis
MGSSRPPLRCVIVPPAPAPYREPLFRALHQRGELDVSVIYQSTRQPSWDVAAEWFATDHRYPARHLNSWQRSRPGRTPIVWPRGLEKALQEAHPDCVLASEYGLASLRALWWCRRHGRAFVVFTECTPQIDTMLAGPQLRLHKWVARHADGIVAVSSAARARLLSFGVPAERIGVALQSADLAPIRAAQPAGARENHRPVTVLSVVRLVPDKNVALLLEAFARALPEAGDAQLEIVGSGFLEPDLRRLAQRLGVPADFRGHVPPVQLGR